MAEPTNSYYRFIRPRQLMPRDPELYSGESAVEIIDWLQGQTPAVVHYDLETTGLAFHLQENIVTTIGLASPDWLIGIDLTDVPFTAQEKLWDWLAKQPLGGFNLGFDAAMPWGPDVTELNLKTDTLLWFRLLATEAHLGQDHTLETLVGRVLGWPAEFQQKAWLSGALRNHKASHAEMWKLALAEPDGYTRYCALDAEASLQAHDIFQETLVEHGFENLNDYFEQIVIPNIKRHIRATYNGIPIDRQLLERNTIWVKQQMSLVEAKLRAHSAVKDFIGEFERTKAASQHKVSVELKKRWVGQDEKPWLRPEQFMLHPADPATLPAWLREYGGKFYEPVKSVSLSRANDSKWPKFNWSSGVDMTALLYEHLLKDRHEIKQHENENRPGYLAVYIDAARTKTFTVDLTKSGALPIGGDILMLVGEVGRLIVEYKELETLLGNFLEKYEIASRKTGKIHAQTKLLGTVTGRMSGGAE